MVPLRPIRARGAWGTERLSRHAPASSRSVPVASAASLCRMPAPCARNS
ncbi:hypothetical protein D187_003687 [Cystobacter fuscus DSM 2262]|uniref:Uncharacterized protein n=1 Tax=Cystobacter fuscus (strain ATCC 25194 / DSM 2262 / NBRC 100088 / M29) TaxID=1242864 RepID=S9P6D0_CYSF2|nr:hypothetical protein D187_003687 [Cystobacter fuscus DSM 2262]